ncbi:hypothetical protein [Nevskia sp.]|uniref:hypothetical protein n=1 Tax=Nevskia sp. TaxID=1929292 RepID=UPI0025DE1C43|nr:hypothetical protein [Nevskia sp.]
MSETPKKKTAAEVLKQALAAKKAAGPNGAGKLRPEMGSGKVNKDAERLKGMSRKVH